MNAVVPFDFNSTIIRTVMKDGEPWFVAREVAILLGYTDPTAAVRQHCRGAVKHLIPSVSGNQLYAVIPESDLWRLIVRSKLPEAQKIEEWLMGTVLPTLRKTGSYIAGEEKLSDPNVSLNDLDAINDRLVELLKQKSAFLEARVEALKNQVEVMAPVAAIAEDTFLLGKRLTLQDFTKRFEGVNTMQVKKSLFVEGYLWIAKGTGNYRVRGEFRDKLFSEKSDERYERHNTTITVLPEGQKILAKLYRAGKLPMKRGFEDAWQAAA